MDTAVKIPLSERINIRLIVFTAVMLGVIGYPIYLFVDEAVSGGIHDRGSYKEVNLQAMSTFSFDQINGTIDQIPQKWRSLDGQKVVLEGEMYAGQSASDELNRFDLCYSRTKCCFSGPPQVQHFVKAHVAGNGTVPYYDSRVRVTGILHVKVVKGDGGVESVYSLDVQKLEEM
jgi:hypothetical protein